MGAPPSQHPNGAQIGWRLLESHCRFDNKMVTLREDKLSVPGKEEPATYAYVERGAGVIIVPVTCDGQMVLVRQYRYAVDQYCLEAPAGTAQDAHGKSLQEVAEKELCEEVGATFDRIERIGSFFSNSALSDEECHVFLAFGVELAQPPDPEPTEEIEIVLKPVREALELARSGGMKTAPAALAVLLAEPILRERGLA